MFNKFQYAVFILLATAFVLAPRASYAGPDCAGHSGPPLLNNTAISQEKGAIKLSRILTAEDSGSEVLLGLGEEIRVELQFQGGTGYAWHLDGLDEKTLKPAGTETVNLAQKGILGGPMLGVWTFNAAAPGSVRLRMLYYRVWEGKDTAIKKFEVNLRIVNRQQP